MIAPANPTEAAPLLRREFALDDGHGPVAAGDAAHECAGRRRGVGERHPELRRAARTGLDELRMARAPRRARRHGCRRRAHCDRLRLGNGWYRGWLGFTGQRAVYGDERAGYAELEIVFADGHVQTVVTDESWRAASRRSARRRPLQRRDDRRAPPRRPRGSIRDSTIRAGMPCTSVEFDPSRLVPNARRRPFAGSASAPWSASGPRPPARRSSTSARTSSASSACGSAAPPAPRSCCGTPRCSRTMSSAPGRCAAPRPPTGSS